jgi:hypothetical protein
MRFVAEYRRRANEVEQLASTAISDEHRRTILDIAQALRTLADQREQMLKRWGMAQAGD